jgi:hypothetical protein
VISIAAFILIPVVACGLTLAAVAPILFKLYRRCRIQDITPEWLENFSPSMYYPMEGLLADEDFRFLSCQPGFDLSLYRKLRRERLYIFRQYFSRLILDFNRLHATARVLVAQGREDRSDLLTQLMWLKLRFSVAVVKTQLSYLICCLGFRSLAVRAVILHLEEMTTQLSFISASQAA